MKKRIAIFASGTGSNLENILRRIQQGQLPCACSLVFSDRPGAPCLEKARNYPVEQVVSFAPKAFFDKMAYETRLMDLVESLEIDYIVLAGYMRILSPRFVRRFPWRIVNIHPALLPSFKGAHAIHDAFQARVEKTGVTVHFVTEEVDGGPLILQEEVWLEPEDTVERLEKKIHAVEHELYPKALHLLLNDQVEVDPQTNRVRLLDKPRNASVPEKKE